MVFVASLIVAGTAVLAGQSSDATEQEQRLKKLFPSAASFSAKEGNPPHYRAYAPGGRPGAQTAVGYAFWTTDLEPLEGGYDGPIQILVGISPQGVLAGIIVAAHREPYGYFSVDPPEFAAQFVRQGRARSVQSRDRRRSGVAGDHHDQQRDARHQEQFQAVRAGVADSTLVEEVKKK